MRVFFTALAACLWLLPGAAEAADYRAPRDAFGRPSLSGVWTSASLTELERPEAFASLTVPDGEASAYEARRPGEFRSVDVDGVGGRAAQAAWWILPSRLARIDGKARTSWIVEPADGRLPYSAQGRAARARRAAASADSSGPEGRGAGERCLTPAWGAAGPPMLNAPYSNLYEIVQTRDDVAIAMEANHNIRIIRLTAAGHLPAHVRPWMGDSIGRWEGETLVVETTNFNAGDELKQPLGLYISKDAKVTERFTRIAEDRLFYEFAVEDPAAYSQTWRGQMVFETAKGPIYEYACHEGNYAMRGMLAGARQEEADQRATPP